MHWQKIIEEENDTPGYFTEIGIPVPPYYNEVLGKKKLQ
jgi:hypothetical protein